MAEGKNPFAGLAEEFKKAPPAGKALAITALVVVAGLGLYVASKNTGTSTSTTGASVLPVDPTLTGGTTGIPFANLSNPVAGGINVLPNPSYQSQTITPLNKGTAGYSNNFYTYVTQGGETIASLNQKANWTGTGNNVQFYRNNADILRSIGYIDSTGTVVNPNAALPAGVKLSL